MGLKVLDGLTLLFQQLCNWSHSITASLTRECNGGILADADSGKSLCRLVLSFLSTLKGKRHQGLAASLLHHKTTEVGVLAEGVQHTSDQLLHILALRGARAVISFFIPVLLPVCRRRSLPW